MLDATLRQVNTIYYLYSPTHLQPSNPPTEVQGISSVSCTSEVCHPQVLCNLQNLCPLPQKQSVSSRASRRLSTCKSALGCHRSLRLFLDPAKNCFLPKFIFQRLKLHSVGHSAVEYNSIWQITLSSLCATI